MVVQETLSKTKQQKGGAYGHMVQWQKAFLLCVRSWVLLHRKRKLKLPILESQYQDDCCKLKASLGYLVNSSPVWQHSTWYFSDTTLV